MSERVPFGVMYEHIKSKTDLQGRAHAFLHQYYAECGHEEQSGFSEDHLARRLDEVNAELKETGTYTHTFEELEYAARVAWRNSNRCIGRLHYRSLEVLDFRHLVTPDDIMQALREYVLFATNKGKIRSAIAVFSPRHPATGREIRIWNAKLVRYAGYSHGAEVIGDPEEQAFTRECERLGWKGRGGRFDLLPVVIQTPDHPPVWYELSAEEALEVPLEHPDFEWFADLKLRWYAVPVISNMTLEAGGIEYTAAPFNGWFMGTEIASRNLGDEQRYNMLPEVARRMGLDVRDKVQLWKDRALVELNTAVLHSYRRAGVTMVDHHTASQQFLQFAERERRAGRDLTGDWSWIVPPMSSSATGVFHRPFDDKIISPNYIYQQPAWLGEQERVDGPGKSAGKSRTVSGPCEHARAEGSGVNASRGAGSRPCEHARVFSPESDVTSQ